ncbi:MAG: D-2-hydroxyacid dehydrogenase [Pseudomonadota bacterium]
MAGSGLPIVVVHGVRELNELPGIERLHGRAEFRTAADGETLQAALSGADVLLGWQFAANDLEQAWPAADRLRWVQWCGAGVDAALFPAFAASDVQLTNMRGIFDRAMAEYALSLILSFAKDLPRTVRAQTARHWDYRLTQLVLGRSALVIGVGGIGQAIGRTLRANGMEVTGVGRRARGGGAAFERIAGADELNALLPAHDFVVLITPLTESTQGIFSAERIALMREDAYFINLGRGQLVDEPALAEALTERRIAGAGLDVFDAEPLPPSSPFWDLDNVIISPHMSGDYRGFHADMVGVFVDNFERYLRGEPLRNVVDKAQGFVPA